jgi:mono/diheme cytochrome c family protein
MVVVVGTAGCADHSLARQNFMLHCMGCHGEDGRGLPGQVPDLRQDLARLLASRDGRAYVLRVPGVTQSSLDPAQTAEVLNFTIREYAASAARTVAPFTAAEVAAARSRPLLEINLTRARALSQIR